MKKLKLEQAIEILRKKNPEVMLFENPSGTDKQKLADYLRTSQQVIVIKDGSWSA